MNAAEARALAEGLNSEQAKSQYDDIKLNISKRAKEGHFSTYWDKDILLSVELQLKSEGYKVSTTFARNEISVTISW